MKPHTALHESRVTDAEQWNTALAELPSAHVLQTWEWGEFKSRYGWDAARYLFQCPRTDRWEWNAGPEADRPRAAASVLTRRFFQYPRTDRWAETHSVLSYPLCPPCQAPWCRLVYVHLPAVMYVPKGPVLDYGDTALLEHVLACLENMARQERALFVKIDPDVRTDTAAGQAVVEILRRRGWRASAEQVQFRNTVCIDLTRSPDELLAAMKSKWRYNTRLAMRKGVTVRRGTSDDLPLLYQMYTETAARDGFVIRPEDYYHDAWGAFIEAGLAQPLIAEVEGEPVAMVLIFRFPSTLLRTSPSTLLRTSAEWAWYMYGASCATHREKMPNHLLQWEAMQWAREQGCTVYDMWGAPDVMDESDPLWGVYRFKRGFGGQFVRHIGAWDFPVSRLGYWLYTTVMPHVLAAMRRQHKIKRGVTTQTCHSERNAVKRRISRYSAQTAYPRRDSSPPLRSGSE